MANPVKGEVPLVLADGRTFTLVLDMQALVAAEEVAGKPLPQLMLKAGQGFMGATAALLQGSLSRNHDVTQDDALEMLRTDGDTIAAALGKASEAAFPKTDRKAGNGPAPKTRHGKPSGRSGAKPG